MNTKKFIGAAREGTDLLLRNVHMGEMGVWRDAQMEKSSHFHLSLSRDLELLRVSRLTDANTEEE